MASDNALQSFKASLDGPSPPEGASPALVALWHLANGDWDTAHRTAQDAADHDGAWVHAHLHRIEGDLDNAAYWYRRARRRVSSAPLQDEWDEIAAALLDAAGAPPAH